MDYAERLARKREEIRTHIRRQALQRRQSRARDNLSIAHIDSPRAWVQSHTHNFLINLNSCLAQAPILQILQEVELLQSNIKELSEDYQWAPQNFEILAAACAKLNSLLANERFGKTPLNICQSLCNTLDRAMAVVPKIGKDVLLVFIALTANSGETYLRCFKRILQSSINYWKQLSNPDICLNICSLFGNVLTMDKTMYTLQLCMDFGVFREIYNLVHNTQSSNDIIDNILWFLSKVYERVNKLGKSPSGELEILWNWFQPLVLSRVRSGDSQCIQFLPIVFCNGQPPPRDIARIVDQLPHEQLHVLSLLNQLTCRSGYYLPDESIIKILQSLWNCDQARIIEVAVSTVYNSCVNQSQSVKVATIELARECEGRPLVSVLLERLEQLPLVLLDLVRFLVSHQEDSEEIRVCIYACIKDLEFQADIEDMGFIIQEGE